jgi:type IV pilus assembly protein PilA
MVSKIKQRLASDEGFTLIELLVVIVILGILLAIAVPSYLGFKDRAEKSAAQANVRAGVPAVEAYYSDNGTYVGMDSATLKAKYDAGIKLDDPASYKVANTTATGYCIQATQGTHVFVKKGPSADIQEVGVGGVTAC